MFENLRIFPKLIGLSALLVAGSAAFFSVFGLSKLFAGATLSVIIMAGSLEFAKLVSASFLYRYWKSVNVLMRSYLTIAIVTLILITSAGIFGFLSNAYQGATIDFEKQTATLFYKEDRLVQLEEDKVYLKEELEQAISELPENYRTAKRQLREEYNPKVIVLNDQILGIKQEVGDLKVGLIETGVDVGPAIYLAKIFNTDIDTVVKFFIFILIFVFDPLAVMLVIAFNQALILRQEETPKILPLRKRINKNWWEIYGETKDKILKREDIEIKSPEPEPEPEIQSEEIEEIEEIEEKKEIMLGKGSIKIV